VNCFSRALWKCDVWILVMTRMWSDSPLRISGSYSTSDVDVLDKMRSTHDLTCYLENVWRAGIPGCCPFRIFHPYSSHRSISHGALPFVVGSSLILCICVLFIVGDKLPTLVFQSPQITCVIEFWKLPRMSSMRLLVTDSSTLRFYRFWVGGIYTLPTHNFSPPCTYKQTPWANSFPMCRITCMPFFTKMAIPPLLPVSLRCSNT
jgi:hypothetical protein